MIFKCVLRRFGDNFTAVVLFLLTPPKKHKTEQKTTTTNKQTKSALHPPTPIPRKEEVNHYFKQPTSQLSSPTSTQHPHNCAPTLGTDFGICDTIFQAGYRGVSPRTSV